MRLQVYEFTSLQVDKLTSLQVDEFTSLQVNEGVGGQFTSLPVDALQVYECTRPLIHLLARQLVNLLYP